MDMLITGANRGIGLALARHAKVLVWAHNTHQGDARASLQGESGELSIGQLMRERLGEQAVFLLRRG